MYCTILYSAVQYCSRLHTGKAHRKKLPAKTRPGRLDVALPEFKRISDVVGAKMPSRSPNGARREEMRHCCV